MICFTQVCWERISGKNLATSHLNSIKIWDIRNPNSPQHYINAHPSKIYALDFSPVKENQLVSSAADNTIKMWNVSKPQKPVNILKVRDGSPVWKVKYTVRRRTTLFFIIQMPECKAKGLFISKRARQLEVAGVVTGFRAKSETFYYAHEFTLQ